MADKEMKDLIALLKNQYRQLFRDHSNMEEAIRNLDCFHPKEDMPLSELRKHGVQVAPLNQNSNGHQQYGIRLSNVGRLTGDRDRTVNTDLVLTRNTARALSLIHI